MIGKGLRNAERVDAMKTYGAVYFGAGEGLRPHIPQHPVQRGDRLPGSGSPRPSIALSSRISPVIVLIDSLGNNLYESGPKLYKQTDL